MLQERVSFTISKHDEEDDQCKRPFKLEAEKNQGNNNINEGWNNAEQDELRGSGTVTIDTDSI
jgi:hypothetical protein